MKQEFNCYQGLHRFVNGVCPECLLTRADFERPASVARARVEVGPLDGDGREVLG